MSITQWTREREQRAAMANRKAHQAYINRVYDHGWQGANGPRRLEDVPNGGIFDFLETAALVAALTLFFLGMRWLLR